MKIVVDNKIPYIQEKLHLLADEVVSLEGAQIGPDDVRDADALIIRTRTRCNKQLLKGSKVQFIATATIGFDHIDADYLKRAGIAWTNCPGCNSGSVAQYVESALLLLQQEKGLDLQQSTIGIVGCGHVGSKVKAVAEQLGMHVLVCDPPLGHADFVSLDVIEQQADVITLHVPLTREGQYATWHLADEAFFRRLAKKPFIINTSRGEVVDGDALLAAMQDGRVSDAVLDVWEHEPQLNLELLQRVFIGTPHIAGYSADGKVNADNMVIDALCKHFNLPHPGHVTPPELPITHLPSHSPLDYYNPYTDSRQLKAEPAKFEYLRNHYPLRREMTTIIGALKTTLLSLLLWVLGTNCQAQDKKQQIDYDSPSFVPTVKVGKVLEDGDSLLFMEMNNVYVFPPVTFSSKKQQAAYSRLVKNVKTVLPIAKEANMIMMETAEYLNTLPDKKARDEHMKRVEKGVMQTYKPRMKKLTYSQGKLLIKLIYRESHSSGYELIQAFLGPVKAGFYQAFAWAFGASLKKEYDPEGIDRLTERVVLMVEAGQL